MQFVQIFLECIDITFYKYFYSYKQKELEYKYLYL